VVAVDLAAENVFKVLKINFAVKKKGFTFATPTK
jgi:hypothetical protein